MINLPGSRPEIAAADLETYRSRGHRRLDTRTYDAKCTTCIWGCRMPVDMIIDHWNPSKKQYRFETFCYGPKSCSFYRPGLALTANQETERVFEGRKIKVQPAWKWALGQE
jgi:hypothetical protein